MSVSSGLQWRWRWLREELRIARAVGGRDRLAMLARLGRRPPSNAQWRLARFGARTLAKVCDAADRHEVPVFLAFGTLLGWVRDDAFIPHDDDIDLGLLDEDWPKAHGLAASLEAAGWDATWFGDDEVRFKHPALGGVAVDIFRFRRTPDGFESRAYSKAGVHVYRFASSLLGAFNRVQAFGTTMRVPHDPEAFLEAHYGDWRSPDPDWDYRQDANSAASRV